MSPYRRAAYRFQIQLFHDDIEEFGDGAISWHGTGPPKACHVESFFWRVVKKEKAGREDVVSGLIVVDWNAMRNAQCVVQWWWWESVEED